MIEALTRQLLARKPILCSKFKSALENPLPTIKDRKALLKSVLTEFCGTFLILDALDEYTTDYIGRHSLASSLQQVVEELSDKRLRCCITSREADGIWQMLSASSVLSQRMYVRSNKEDITHMVQTLYNNASKAIIWLKDNQDLQRMAVTKVVEKSGCM